MTHPTDAELESTAAELQRFAANDLIDRAAALLRACKSPAPDAQQEAWRAGIGAAAERFIDGETGLSGSEVKRIIRALAEKGPGHEA